jgi:hypothetical protein
MGHVNLIPAERLLKRRRKARLCLWTAACSAYVVLLLAGSLFFHVVYATEDRSADRLVTDGWSEPSAQPLTEFLTGCRHRLLLTGFGKSQESVSRFVLRLEESGVFDAVRLISSCRQTFLQGDAVAFSVECRF